MPRAARTWAVSVAINLFVIPIALAGLVSFPFGAVDSDMYVLALPMEGNSPWLSVGVFVGGLSAATAMVIVECVALSIMVSNDIVVLLVLQRGAPSRAGQKDFGNFVLRVRRFAIFAIMVMAYFYYPRSVTNWYDRLVVRGHAQLAPAFFGGLFWRARPRGVPGRQVGGAVWIYTLFLPSFMDGSTGDVRCSTARIAAARRPCSALICRRPARRALSPSLNL
jgi:Na+/proline symporter